MRNRLASICAAVARWNERAIGLLLLLIVLVNLAQVGFRMTGAPLGWTEEAMRYGIVWVTFLGAGVALFRGEHMAIDLVGEYGGGAALRQIAGWAALAATMAFAGILVWKGAPFALRGLGQDSPSAQIPMIVPYGAVAVGGALMLLQGIALLVAGREMAELREREH